MAKTNKMTYLRREIMKIIPAIKTKSRFRNWCGDMGIEPVGEVREGHVMSKVYPRSALRRLRERAKMGDMRRRP